MGTRIKPNVFSSIAVRIAQDIAVVNKIIERIVCMPMDPACNVLSVLYKPYREWTQDNRPLIRDTSRITSIVIHGTGNGGTLSPGMDYLLAKTPEKDAQGNTIPGGGMPLYNVRSPGRGYGMMFGYCIDSNGDIAQYFPDSYWNYHSQSFNWDETSIGIELMIGPGYGVSGVVGHGMGPDGTFANEGPTTTKQFLSLIRLIVYLKEKYPSIATLFSHSWLSQFDQYGGYRYTDYSRAGLTAFFNGDSSEADGVRLKNCPGMNFMITYMFPNGITGY